jgi:hypothetical protein
MRSIVALLAVLCVAAPALAFQAAGQQQQAEPPKTEETAAPASIAGKWNVVTTSDQGRLTSVLDIKLEETKVTGSITSEMGTSAIEGEWKDGALGFGITMETANGPFSLWFAGALKDDGSLAGTIDFGQGTLPWTATRAKG